MDRSDAGHFQSYLPHRKHKPTLLCLPVNEFPSICDLSTWKEPGSLCRHLEESYPGEMSFKECPFRVTVQIKNKYYEGRKDSETLGPRNGLKTANIIISSFLGSGMQRWFSWVPVVQRLSWNCSQPTVRAEDLCEGSSWWKKGASASKVTHRTVGGSCSFALWASPKTALMMWPPTSQRTNNGTGWQWRTDGGTEGLRGRSPKMEPVISKSKPRDVPGGPVAKSLHSQCKGPGLEPWSGN